jgi:membrane-bound lytic murein transglycosylase MltF
MKRSTRTWLLVIGLAALIACTDTPATTPAGTGPTSTDSSIDQIPAELTATAETASQTPAVMGTALQSWRGGINEIRERKLLRVLVGYSQTHYFLDGLTPRGITADSLREFEKFLQRELKLKQGSLTLLPIPVARDQMIELLAQGQGELAIGNLTVTNQRLEQVDFSVPLASGIQEVVVTGPGAATLTQLDDLAGQRVFIRKSSSFFESVRSLNDTFSARQLPPIEVIAANENLQTEDILELVSAGVVDITIADSYLADFWSGILPDL